MVSPRGFPDSRVVAAYMTDTDLVRTPKRRTRVPITSGCSTTRLIPALASTACAADVEVVVHAGEQFEAGACDGPQLAGGR